jgi:hypothetical protein
MNCIGIRLEPKGGVDSVAKQGQEGYYWAQDVTE